MTTYPTSQVEMEKLIGEFGKIMTDFPRAWAVCKEACSPDQHHEECSWRTASMLCDCAADKAFIYCIDNFVAPYQKIIPYIRTLQSRNAALEEERQKLQRALGFASSVIKSGEPWTESCEKIISEALYSSPSHD